MSNFCQVIFEVKTKDTDVTEQEHKSESHNVKRTARQKAKKREDKYKQENNT